jgi:hypothetical protein
MSEFGSLNAAYREIGYAPNLNPEREENRDLERRMERTGTLSAGWKVRLQIS